LLHREPSGFLGVDGQKRRELVRDSGEEAFERMAMGRRWRDLEDNEVGGGVVLLGEKMKRFHEESEKEIEIENT
jgi:hypothetical protein